MGAARAYQWLFFDADGTLFDYDAAEASALEGAFRDFDLPFDGQASETYRVINHQIWEDFEKGLVTPEGLRVLRFERLFSALNIQSAAGLFSERYLMHLARSTHLIAGAEELLQSLRGKYCMAIITNGLKDVQRSRLARSTIHSYFREVMISEEMGVAKPDPRFFEMALQRCGSPLRDHVLVIGDSLTSDIQGGNGSGMDTCWFNPSGRAADPRFPAVYTIQSLGELYPLLLPGD
jgi:YjjG family noncanonical pyrimidine nucleotidase